MPTPPITKQMSWRFFEAPSSGSALGTLKGPIISYMALNGNENQSNFFVGINNDNNCSLLLPTLELVPIILFY